MSSNFEFWRGILYGFSFDKAGSKWKMNEGLKMADKGLRMADKGIRIADEWWMMKYKGFKDNIWWMKDGQWRVEDEG